MKKSRQKNGRINNSASKSAGTKAASPKNTPPGQDGNAYAWFTAGRILTALFFVLLVLSVCASFSDYDRTLYHTPVSILRVSLAILTTLIGIAYVFFHRQQINALLAEESGERPAGECRTASGSSRSATYSGKRVYAAGLMILVAASMAIYSYKLDNLDFRTDEYLVVGSAAGYYHAGKFNQWDFLENRLSENVYTRSWPHTWLVAQSYKIFGISEWSSRIISVLFGVLFVLLSYIVAHHFSRDRFSAYIFAATIMLYPKYVDFFRWTRMYALLIPLFLILGYAVYRTLTEELDIGEHSGRVAGFYKTFMNFHYGYFLAALALLPLAYIIHPNSLLILPIGFLFFLYLAVTAPQKKYIFIFMLSALTLPVLIHYLPMKWFLDNLHFFKIHNYVYFKYLFAYPFSMEAGISILLIGGAVVCCIKQKSFRDRLAFLYLITAVAIIFFVFTANRYPGFKYSAHCNVFGIMLIVYLFILLGRSFRSKTALFILTFLLLARVGFVFYMEYDGLYNRHPLYGSPSVAYKTLQKEYNPDRETLVAGPYFRPYYYDSESKPIKSMKDLPRNFIDFVLLLKNTRCGWITWETSYSYLVDPQIVNFVHQACRKVHGAGLDDTRIEMFHYDLDRRQTAKAGN